MTVAESCFLCYQTTQFLQLIRFAQSHPVIRCPDVSAGIGQLIPGTKSVHFYSTQPSHTLLTEIKTLLKANSLLVLTEDQVFQRCNI